MVLGCIYVSFQDRKRVNGQSPATTSAANDATPLSSSNFQPLVLVQLPMYNERTCYRQCIAAACQLEWYKGKLVIQVNSSSSILPFFSLPLLLRFHNLEYILSSLIVASQSLFVSAKCRERPQFES